MDSILHGYCKYRSKGARFDCIVHTECHINVIMMNYVNVKSLVLAAVIRVLLSMKCQNRNKMVVFLMNE